LRELKHILKGGEMERAMLLPDGRIRRLIAKTCPKCNQVYSPRETICPNEECRGCLLVGIYGEAEEVRIDLRSNNPPK
jgi:uncharacterized OB-fold protein